MAIGQSNPFLRICLVGFSGLGVAQAQGTGEVRGGILDARGGEPLARVLVQLLGTSYQALTDYEGRFACAGIPPGNCQLHVSTVGYRVLEKALRKPPPHSRLPAARGG